MFIRRILIASAMASLMLASTSSADQYDEQVLRYLAGEVEPYVLNSWELVDSTVDTDLADNAFYTFWAGLEAGSEYIFVGACDNDCSDIDMVVFDTNNQHVVSDFTGDDSPNLRMTAKQSGNHGVVISMANCKAEPCSIGLAILRRSN